MSPSEQLSLYRSAHVIYPIRLYGPEPICALCEVRVVQNLGGGWRHDPADIRDLVRQEAETIWPS